MDKSSLINYSDMKFLKWIVLALFISACAAPKTQANPQAAQETAFAMAWTTVAQTQAAVPTTLPTETMTPPATQGSIHGTI
jgi:PBP1b-binding outer membrane lipoprotein LpoB